MSRYRRRSAYYSRNNSYSRSYNASQAESQGRLPRTRAAAHLGLSVKAFDAGCAAAGYSSSEWHHVGKYANMVDYYDTGELEQSAAFWKGAMDSCKTKARRREIRGQALAHLIGWTGYRSAARVAIRRFRASPQYGHAQLFVNRHGQCCVEYLPLGPFKLLPVNGRFFKVLAGPGFPPGAIVDKSLFNDFRQTLSQ